MEKLITVLTATYNRAHLLPDLYHSLCRQTFQDFEWVIVDDGSSDGTEELVRGWLFEEHFFHIKYMKKENGGKNRAINDGVKFVRTPYTVIVDSDDFLTDDAIEFLSQKAVEVLKDDRFAGISGLRGNSVVESLGVPSFDSRDYIDCDNLSRNQYGLEKDACEVYKTKVLQSHPFIVWEGEKFSPEEIVWDTIAKEGMSLRWYNKITLVVRYQKNGLTKDSFSLMKANPMGYAMLYKHRVNLSNNFKDKYFWNCQLIANSILGKNILYSSKSNVSFCYFLALPIGFILFIRRFIQYSK